MITVAHGATCSMLRCPPVSTSTCRPASCRRAIRGYTSFCRRGSPPVISTSGQPKARTASTTSSTDIFRPSWKAYGLSHQTQRRSHAVRRTNTHGRPA
ncbi:MAG: hypothetical protein R2708_16590 [Vicinamibacterales bacterium]